MAKTNYTSVRGLIDKTNTTVVVVTSIAAFVTIFSLVASKTFISQATYQNRVISAKNKAVSQLKSDLAASNELDTSYKAFAGQDQNIIGGNSTGTGPQDGNNAKIVLDALPSSYDFPALATTLEKLTTQIPGLAINNITGTDDEVNQSANTTSATPQPVPMPFQLSVTGDYTAIQQLVDRFEHSIRPFQVQTMNISGDQGNLTMNLTAQTFYQPAKTFNISTKEIK